MSARRSIVALAAAVSVLSACGASAPPAKELANEMVDTMLNRGDITGPQATCMHDTIDNFGLTAEQAQGFDDFDDVANKAAQEQELALRIMDDFEAALAACR